VSRQRSCPMSSSQITSSPKDPQCPECGCLMWLYHIKPHKPWYDERTFQCPRCLYVDQAVAEVA
jgi:hypothetical protein